MTKIFSETLDSPFTKNRPVANQDAYASRVVTVGNLEDKPETHKIYEILGFEALHKINREALKNSSELFTLAAVSDGAGSLSRSHEGAQFATERFIKMVSKIFSDLISNPEKFVDSMNLREFVDSDEMPEDTEIDTVRETNTLYIIEQVLSMTVENISQALKSKEDYKQLGATFTGLMTVGKYWVIITVGDSFAVVRDKGEYSFIQSPQLSDFHNVTELLTSTNYQKFTASGNSYESIFLASDGLQNASIEYKTLEPTPSFWDFIHTNAQSAENDSFVKDLLNFMNQQEKIDDDTTLVIVTSE